MAESTESDIHPTVPIVDKAVHDIGAAWMLDPATAARGKDAGYANPFAFYFAGRGGVLGDVDADVVAAAFGYFDPAVVRACWDEGVAVAGAREAARRYGRACAEWGEEHLADLDDAAVDRLTELTGRVAAAAEGSGLPLFCGWRAEPTADGGRGRLMQLINVLREWRGALHLPPPPAPGPPPRASPRRSRRGRPGPGAVPRLARRRRRRARRRVRARPPRGGRAGDEPADRGRVRAGAGAVRAGRVRRPRREGGRRGAALTPPPHRTAPAADVRPRSRASGPPGV